MSSDDFHIASMAQQKEVKKTFEDAGIQFLSVDELREEIYILVNFLQSNGMTIRPLVNSVAQITDDFELRSRQLTYDGILFLRGGRFARFRKAKINNKLKSLERSLEEFKQLTEGQKNKLKLPTD